MAFCVIPGEQFKTVLSRMSQLASSGATELRVRSLDAVSQLLTLQACTGTSLTSSKSSIQEKPTSLNEYPLVAARAADRRPLGSDRVLVPPPL